MRLYGAITKVEEQDDGTLIVSGIASSECVDSEGETVLASAMKDALPDYMKFGAVREMHQPIAAGTALSAEVASDGCTYFEALVVDDDAVKKVKTGVYKGFSIGGRVPAGGRNKDNPKIIERINLVEVSLVDRPANPEAVIQLAKMEAPVDPVAPASPDSAAAAAPAPATTPPAAPAAAAAAAVPPAPAVAEPAAPAAPAETAPAAAVVPAVAAPAPTPAPAPAPAAAAPVAPAEAPKAAAAAPSGDVVEKSLYHVGWAAEVLSSLNSLGQSLAYEEQSEGTTSGVPAGIKAACGAMCDALKAMVDKEVAELMGDSEKAAAAVADAMQKRAARLEKKGARFSADTKKALQAHSDALAAVHKSLGDCHKAFGEMGWKQDDDVEDAAGATAIAQAAQVTDLQKRAQESDAAREAAHAALADVVAKRDELAKRLAEAEEKLQRAGGPALTVVPVDKSQDTGGGASAAKVDETPKEPVASEKGDLGEFQKALKKPVPFKQFVTPRR